VREIEETLMLVSVKVFKRCSLSYRSLKAFPRSSMPPRRSHTPRCKGKGVGIAHYIFEFHRQLRCEII
jgi:hypothetical protein